MLVTPNNFPTQNNHRIALFQPDIAHTDFDQIEDIGADAIFSARAALGQLEQLSHELLRPIDGFVKTIVGCVDQRRILGDDFCHAALFVLKHLAREDCGDDAAGDIDLNHRLSSRCPERFSTRSGSAGGRKRHWKTSRYLARHPTQSLIYL